MAVRGAKLFLSAILLPATMLLIVACVRTKPVLLHHAESDQTATCGPYRYIGFADKELAFERERACIGDYQRQGYERAPE